MLMTTRPLPTRIFHITAIDNLTGILAADAILSKNSGASEGIGYQNIAHRGAQGARASKAVPEPPGGVVHDYVPFYFAPRSPMLFAINGGKVAGCDYRQSDIIYFESTVEAITELDQPIVFYDRNATLAFSRAYSDLGMLDTAVAWDLLTEPPCLDGYCKYWQNRPEDRYADRMERRQAEFLVKDFVPLNSVSRLGVFSEKQQGTVEQMLTSQGLDLPVQVVPDWYF
jgi:hypothetical protein